jgi:hypothetical protein
MRLKLLAATALVAVGVAVLAGTTEAATAGPAAQQSITAPISGTTQNGGVVNGVFQITSFTVNQAGQLVANGVLNGTLTDAAGNVTNLVNTAVSSVVTNQATGGGCQVLDLTLGPLHLDLLGLVVDLNQVHLNITAQPGPGNLLGNLLCGVTHLLDNGNTNGLQNLLNLLNGLLG